MCSEEPGQLASHLPVSAPVLAVGVKDSRLHFGFTCPDSAAQASPLCGSCPRLSPNSLLTSSEAPCSSQKISFLPPSPLHGLEACCGCKNNRVVGNLHGCCLSSQTWHTVNCYSTFAEGMRREWQEITLGRRIR